MSTSYYDVVLLGKTGSGKSATGNTLLGQKHFSQSHTSVVQRDRVCVSGLTLKVHDTPGFFYPERSNDDIVKQCQPLFQLNSSFTTVFLLVMKIDRFTQEDKGTVELIEKLVPECLHHNIWILFTRGDELESEGLSIEQLIEETDELKRVIQRFNNRYHVFNNIQTHNCDQVSSLMEKIKANMGGTNPLYQTTPSTRDERNIQQIYSQHGNTSVVTYHQGRRGVGKFEINMSKKCSSDVLVKNSIKKVVDPLKDGLWSINRVYEALIDGDVDPFSGQCRNYSFIREQIVGAQQSLQKSEQAASSGLKSLDENIEILTRDEGRLEQEKRDTQQTLDNLKTEQESNNKLLKQSEDSLEVARSHLRSSRDTLQAQEERKRTAGIVTGVGAGLRFIPVVGWIAGSAMIIGGAVELAEASKAGRVSEEEERKSESEVDRYRSRVSEYNSKISQTKSKISQKHDQIEQICKKIQKVKEQRAAVGEFQSNMRKAVHILSILSGRVSAVECQTRRFIHLEPVMKVIEDVMKVATDIGGSQLLSNEDVPRLLNTMWENNRKLAAICNSSNNPEHESYY